MRLPSVFPCHWKMNDILVGHFGYDSVDVVVFMHTDCRLSHYRVRRGRLQVFVLTDSIQEIELRHDANDLDLESTIGSPLYLPERSCRARSRATALDI